MKTLDEIRDALALHREELGKKYKAKEIGIFGSYVTGADSGEIGQLVRYKPAAVTGKSAGCGGAPLGLIVV